MFNILINLMILLSKYIYNNNWVLRIISSIKPRQFFGRNTDLYAEFYDFFFIWKDRSPRGHQKKISIFFSKIGNITDTKVYSYSENIKEIARSNAFDIKCFKYIPIYLHIFSKVATQQNKKTITILIAYFVILLITKC